MSKHDRALRLDRRVIPNYEDGDLPAADYIADDLAPPAPPAIQAPTNLQLTAFLTRSAQAGMAMIVATWDLTLNGGEADSFSIQVSTSPVFADVVTQTFTALSESASLENLKVATLYYVRVLAVYRSVVGAWSTVASITTPVDNSPPAAVTSVAWEWLANGDLVLTWAASISENYKDAEVRIYASSTKTIHLRTIYGRTGAVYTAAMNYADTGNIPVASVYIELYSRSYGNVYGPVALPPNQPSKLPPAVPTGLTSSWVGDAGLAGPDCDIKWASQTDAVRWRLTIDGITVERDTNSFTYTIANNWDAHSGIPDPSLALSLVAVDGIGQRSQALSAYATNVKPPATSLVIGPGFSIIGVAITSSLAADLKDYRIRVVKDGQTVSTLRTSDPNTTCDISKHGSGSYQIGVSVVDIFEQVSAETLSQAVSLDPLTVETLRLDAGYDDDITTSLTTLDTLKDTITVSGGVYYP